ncbi:thioesterase II family protein [Neorhodopirellula lusitana]|uniref:thioesterase II family protein n=1 Tax=Neorhodopirellula lusitana TaxID=445327 RepID=UPI00384AFABA
MTTPPKTASTVPGTDPEVWFRAIGEFQPGRRNVVWFPHAGGGAAPLIRASHRFPPAVNLWAATLPGREGRYADPRPDTLDSLVNSLAQSLPEAAGTPVLAGHSYGALLAYLVARKLASQFKRKVAGILVMAMSAPNQLGHLDSIVHLANREFAEQLDKRYGGVPKALRENAEAMQLFLPTVRHDMQMLESYQDDGEVTLGVPILALAGTADSATTPERMQGWNEKTTGPFELRSIEGDHFFPLADIQRTLGIAAAI